MVESEAVRIRALVVECCGVLDACGYGGPVDDTEAGALEVLRAELLALAAVTDDRDAGADAHGVVGLIDDVLVATPVVAGPIAFRAAS